MVDGEGIQRGAKMDAFSKPHHWKQYELSICDLFATGTRLDLSLAHPLLFLCFLTGGGAVSSLLLCDISPDLPQYFSCVTSQKKRDVLQNISVHSGRVSSSKACSVTGLKERLLNTSDSWANHSDILPLSCGWTEADMQGRTFVCDLYIEGGSCMRLQHVWGAKNATVAPSRECLLLCRLFEERWDDL